MPESRYIPFTQQPYCCVPTCLQMILYKNGLPLLSQEVIGKDLGLVVPTPDKGLFFDVEARDEPVVTSGFGTRVQDRNYSVSSFIQKHGLPFSFLYIAASELANPQDLVDRLAKAEADDGDVMVCFEVGAVYNNGHHYGHVCVLDGIVDGDIVLVDPSPQHPKQLHVKPETLYRAITKHGNKNYAGLWMLERQK